MFCENQICVEGNNIGITEGSVVYMDNIYVNGNNNGVIGSGSNNIVINSLESEKFNDTLALLKEYVEGLPKDDNQNAKECIEVIEAEVTSSNPKKGLLKRAFDDLLKITGDERFQGLVNLLLPIVNAVIERS